MSNGNVIMQICQQTIQVHRKNQPFTLEIGGGGVMCIGCAQSECTLTTRHTSSSGTLGNPRPLSSACRTAGTGAGTPGTGWAAAQGCSTAWPGRGLGRSTPGRRAGSPARASFPTPRAEGSGPPTEPGVGPGETPQMGISPKKISTFAPKPISRPTARDPPP